MGKFSDFASKEELLKAIEAKIVETQNDDGETVYSLLNEDADNYRLKYEAEVKNAQKQRNGKQKAEQELAEAVAEKEELTRQVEELNKLNPSDLKETIQRYVSQTSELTRRNKELEAEIGPLREANDAYRRKETTAKIEEALVESAKKMDCCDSALRDVKRLASAFEINEAGLIVSKDNQQLVDEVLEEEIKHSPHWLKRSLSAGTNPPNAGMSNEAKFREALKGDDFGAVLANAPTIPIAR